MTWPEPTSVQMFLLAQLMVISRRAFCSLSCFFGFTRDSFKWSKVWSPGLYLLSKIRGCPPEDGLCSKHHSTRPFAGTLFGYVFVLDATPWHTFTSVLGVFSPTPRSCKQEIAAHPKVNPRVFLNSILLLFCWWGLLPSGTIAWDIHDLSGPVPRQFVSCYFSSVSKWAHAISAFRCGNSSYSLFHLGLLSFGSHVKTQDGRTPMVLWDKLLMLSEPQHCVMHCVATYRPSHVYFDL